MSSASAPANDTKHVKNALEWTVFAASCLLVLATLVILIMDAATAGQSPAKIRVQPGQPYQADGRLWIPVEVSNSGGRAAAAIEVEASRPSQPGESPAGISIDYLPRGATRKGQVSFPVSKADVPVEFRVSSFQEP